MQPPSQVPPPTPYVPVKVTHFKHVDVTWLKLLQHSYNLGSHALHTCTERLIGPYTPQCLLVKTISGEGGGGGRGAPWEELNSFVKGY